MTVIVQDQLVARCHVVLRRAAFMFPHLSFNAVEIKLNLRGHRAAVANRDVKERYSIRFNREYLAYDASYVLQELVPHEVAHIARFMDSDDGTHGEDWKKICMDLGGKAETTHPMPKVFCKGRTFEYTTTNGYTVRVSEHMHNKIQAGAAYAYTKAEGIVNKHCAYNVI